MTGLVRTVLGDVEPGALGMTYAHEHVLLDSPLVRDRFPHVLLDDVDAAVTELQTCAAAGVGAMVDAMPCAGGRDAQGLARVAAASGVNIIATTGLHVRRWYPGRSWANECSPQVLAELFIADIEVGIDRFDYLGPVVDRTDHRAGVVKVGTMQPDPDDRDRRLFAAAALAHQATGAPILTHCEEGGGGLEQIALLADLGVAPERIVLSHTDKVDDVVYHQDLLATGAYLEFDQALRHPVDAASATVRLVAALVEAGHADRLMLGTDGARRSLWSAYGGSPGLAALAAELLPVLAAAGVADGAIRQIMVANPARFFAFSKAAS